MELKFTDTIANPVMMVIFDHYLVTGHPATVSEIVEASEFGCTKVRKELKRCVDNKSVDLITKTITIARSERDQWLQTVRTRRYDKPVDAYQPSADFMRRFIVNLLKSVEPS